MDESDLLFVCELSPNYQGWFPKPAWQWIEKRFPMGVSGPTEPPPSLKGLGYPDRPSETPENPLLRAIDAAMKKNPRR
jgi:hypothetical protein